MPTASGAGTDRPGILLLNLGTPSAPTASAIRRFLREFLQDRRVVDLNRALWLPILFGFILPFRPRKLVPAYASVWLPEGSPLLVYTRRLAGSLSQQLGLPVSVAMRYGQPSVAAALQELKDQGCSRFLALPLYPQFSHTTTSSALDALTATLQMQPEWPTPTVISDYHDDADHIAALADSVRAHWDTQGRGDHLLISFHSIPQRYVRNGDPYERQCRVTANLLAQALSLQPQQWSLAFQSRLGREPWLQPYTDMRLPELADDGVRTLDVLCPGFAVECLETLEEVAIRYAQTFVDAGGQALRYIPALNDRPAHTTALAALIRRNLAQSPQPPTPEGVSAS